MKRQDPPGSARGVLVIRKEAGYTSHDVVAKLRRILGMRRIGHTGTLDPDAEGVLPVTLGMATRLTELLSDRPKTYETVLRLGVVTETQDLSGKIIEEKPVQVDEDRLREAAASFVGEQMQIPPMYSALKVDGRKLYELAREGKTIERQPRPVTFYQVRVIWVRLPQACLEITCSKGTYIRTFCHDLGERLGCGGCMEKLVRTAVGSFTLDQAHTLSEVEAAAAEGEAYSLVIGLEEVLRDYPRRHCLKEGDRLLRNGNSVPAGLLRDQELSDRKVRLCTEEGIFWGVYERKCDRYCPVKMFPPEQ